MNTILSGKNITRCDHIKYTSNKFLVDFKAITFFFTHANDRRGSKAFSGDFVCLCVYLIRTIQPKRLKLKSPNLAQG